MNRFLSKFHKSQPSETSRNLQVSNTATTRTSATVDVTPGATPPTPRGHLEENALDVLRKFNTVILVDDSTSMAYHGRWEEAKTALAPLAKTAAAYDTDGIDICFLNSAREGKNLKDPDQVVALFNTVTPRGWTPIGARLKELINAYIDTVNKHARGPRELRPKPVNFIVITDGVPTDEGDLKSEVVIKAAAKRLDDGRHLLHQVGIQFVQIGSDREATEYLDMLDNDLEGARDIVDTTPYSGHTLTTDTIIKILIGGINRRVDKDGAGYLKQNFV